MVANVECFVLKFSENSAHAQWVDEAMKIDGVDITQDVFHSVPKSQKGTDVHSSFSEGQIKFSSQLIQINCKMCD